MSNIQFTIAAKTDVGLVRDNNEDNLQCAEDLSVQPMTWVNNKVCQLGDNGTLLVVADGMGGMNAGEVASAIAIEAIRDWFSPQRITPEVKQNRYTIEKFMSAAIVDADSRIKAQGQSHPDQKGMGTTIVVAWILEGKLYVSWCGDSRAYIYSKSYLRQVTKDHSYVQGLVDKGVITADDAFDHPDSNIITRSLSDSQNKARPDSLLQPIPLHDGDIVLLCTDGLCGMVRDTEIEQVVSENTTDMNLLADQLIMSACNADGADNITVCICKIISGCGEVFHHHSSAEIPMYDKNIDSRNSAISHSHWYISLLVALILFIGGCIAGWFVRPILSGTIAPTVMDTADTVVDTIPISVMESGDEVGLQDTLSSVGKSDDIADNNTKTENNHIQMPSHLTAQYQVYKIRECDTTWQSIADSLGYSVDSLIEICRLSTDSLPKTGSTIRVPKKSMK